MKVEILEPKEVEEVVWGNFKIFEGHRNDRLYVDGPEYRIIIQPTRVFIQYEFHRPNHDHNNRPAIKLDIPKGGAGRNGDAKLTVEADSGFYPDLFLDFGYGKKRKLKPESSELS